MASAIVALSPVIVVKNSQDAKLSTDKSVAATWVSQASCPKDCPFFPKEGEKGVCYANTGRAGMHTARINNSQKLGRHSIIQLAEIEAAGIRNLPGKTHLRIHVVGDCTTPAAAKVVSAAAEEYMLKHGMIAWTYTHAKKVPRKAWGKVSVLRSCQSVEEAKREHKRGYAAAVVVAEKHASAKTVDLGGGFRGIPCPVQTKKAASCKDCGLCLHAAKLHERKAFILFEPDRGTDAGIKGAIQN